ncbi:hypothetical protein GW17_00004466 [Ensete ventricosum]|nr:hypothetical protein GW17_00004466 [Ensete ventricosum]RZS25697.1 hypothetical protein BHM03_00058938 [Ensete ventricosum]
MATANSALANGCDKGPSPGRLSSVYSEVQTSRLNHPLRLPSVLKGPFKLVDGPPSSAAGNPDYLQERAKGSILYGFKGGPAGIMKCKYVQLTPEFIYPYRNQVFDASFSFSMSISFVEDGS